MPNNKKDKSGNLFSNTIAPLLLMAATYCLIAFTPLRFTIPGYPNKISRMKALESAARVDSLEIVIARWSLYSENLDRILTGRQTISVDTTKAGVHSYLSNRTAEEYARQDSILKAEFRQDEAYQIQEIVEGEKPIEAMNFYCPLKGSVSQAFDNFYHPAVDITAAAGDPVSCVLDGTILFTDWTDKNGYTIIVQHKSNILSIYTHNQKLLKKKGDKIDAGTAIALVGNTGALTSDDHLHFELWYKGKPVDPAKYIKF